MGPVAPSGGPIADGSATMNTPVPVQPSSSAVPDSKGRPAGKHWAVATAFVIPYLVLMVCWAFTNPRASAPDEPSHFMKAVGMATFDIGSPYTGTETGGGLGAERNRSISRVIPVPANLVPHNPKCEVLHPTVSAGCRQQQQPITSTAIEYRVDVLGSYPPFLYVPMGWAARLGSDAVAAFYRARLFCALASASLLLLGAAHLTRALGRRALLGAFVALTPVVIFSCSTVTTSGMEICAAFATVCIVVAGLRRRETLAEPGTQLLLAGVGATLILSRQLGVVTFALLMLLLLVRIGPGFFWNLARARTVAFLSSAGILLVSGISVAWWELAFDHPSHVGTFFSESAFGAFSTSSYSLVRSGVALFGWLDTGIPAWFIAMWIAVLLILVGAAVLLGSRADRWTLLIWSVVMMAVGYFTYATVFYPVGASLQGRHLLAVFTLIPLLAGITIVGRADSFDPAVGTRLFRIVAVTIPLLQFVSLYLNGRRYAVGTNGPVWFLPVAQWQPPSGWALWLLMGFLACCWMGRNIWTMGVERAVGTPEPTISEREAKERADVER